jgi:hypothetical protein
VSSSLRPEPPAELDVAWERPGAGLVERLLGTLGGAFMPARSAPAMQGGDSEAAFRFLWLTAIPLTLLAGVIPHTRTLLFGDVFSIKLTPGSSEADIALDVGRAMLVQLAMFVVDFLALSLPYGSLARSYGPPHANSAALRLLCYRAWLIPAAALIYSLIAWGAPMPALPITPENPPVLPFWLELLMVTPFWLHALMLVGMWFGARRACQLGPGMATVVTGIPFLLWSVLQPFQLQLVSLVLPVATGAG